MFRPSDEWLHEYVVESNRIDPQPGHKNVPGDPHYDDHLTTLKGVISCGNKGLDCSPFDVHGGLMHRLKGMEKEFGRLRTYDVEVGGRICPSHWDIAHMMWEWSQDVVYKLGGGQQYWPKQEKEILVWRIHVDYERIHPFADGNGRSGRLLMVNHAIILGLEPWIVRYNDRVAYYARF